MEPRPADPCAIDAPHRLRTETSRADIELECLERDWDRTAHLTFVLPATMVVLAAVMRPPLGPALAWAAWSGVGGIVALGLTRRVQARHRAGVPAARTLVLRLVSVLAGGSSVAAAPWLLLPGRIGLVDAFLLCSVLAATTSAYATISIGSPVHFYAAIAPATLSALARFAYESPDSALVLLTGTLVYQVNVSLAHHRAHRSVIDGIRTELELARNRKLLLAANAEAEHLATHDALTGLANRRRFTQLAEQALPEAADGQLALLIADLDHFKTVNDTYGHPVGDAVLQRAAAVLRERVRVGDVVARLGGEEFAVLAPGCDAAGAAGLAASLVEAVRATPFDHADRPGAVTVSIGVAVFETGTDLGTLLKRADDALYAAKTGGRDRFVSA